MVFETNVYLSILIVAVSIISIEIYNGGRPKHPHAGLDIEQLVKSYGYDFEAHQVVTEDGYVLNLHRIPNGKKSTAGAVPVLLMPGFTQTAKDFVNLGSNRSLAFLLWKQGYDVWLGNIRGCTYSRKHKHLDPDLDRIYWDFSFHEIAIYDVPAIINHILRVTRQETLHYVGYSQGTTLFFILGTEKPEYSRKVRFMTALAPTMFMNGTKGPVLNTLKYMRSPFKLLVDLFGFDHILHQNTYIVKFFRYICNENSIFVNVCLFKLALLHGFNYEEVNKTDLSLIFSTTPDGGSARQLLYILQLMRSENFLRYDFGTTKNIEKYGQAEPLPYDVSKLQTPIALYYSQNDWAINSENVERIKQTLPNVVKSYQVPMKSFNHNDFMYAKNVVNLLYDEVIDTMSKY